MTDQEQARALNRRRADEVPYVNALRGFAALWVVLGHCRVMTGQTVTLLPNARPAVDLFMIISGFLMMHVSSRVAHGEGPRGWPSFYIRRYFRLAPVYYLALGLVFVFWGAHRAGFSYFRSLQPTTWAGSIDYDRVVFDLPNLITHVTFLFGFSPEYSFSTFLPDWSLAVEAQFYALFPLVFWAAAARRWWLLPLAGLTAIAATIAYNRLVAHQGWPAFRESSLLLFHLQMFIVGVLVYVARRPGVRIVVLLAAALLLAGSYRRPDVEALLVVGLTVSLAAVWIASPVKLVDSWSRLRVVSFASDTSYPAYLLHGFMLTLVGAPVMRWMTSTGFNRWGSAIIVTTIVLLLTYALSALIHTYVEAPGNAAGRSLSRQVPRQQAARITE